MHLVRLHRHEMMARLDCLLMVVLDGLLESFDLQGVYDFLFLWHSRRDFCSCSGLHTVKVARTIRTFVSVLWISVLRILSSLQREERKKRRKGDDFCSVQFLKIQGCVGVRWDFGRHRHGLVPYRFLWSFFFENSWVVCETYENGQSVG